MNDTKFEDRTLVDGQTITSWYQDNIPLMTLDVLKRHHLELETYDDSDAKNALTLVAARIDELLPKLPGHAEVHANNVHTRWPLHLPYQTYRIHIHLRELLYAWNLSPCNTGGRDSSVDEFAETEGITRFVFSGRSDPGNFMDFHGLNDFLVGEIEGLSSPAGSFFYLTLTNKFHEDDVNKFLGVYGRSINTLAIIYEERRRAVQMDGGKIGFITADHFTTREQIALNNLRAAREALGAGFKGGVNGTRETP